jgi:hypothetical protein
MEANFDHVTIFPDGYVEAMRQQGVMLQDIQSREKEWLQHQRALWRELFLSVTTANALECWESKLSKYECDCKRFYTEWKSNNPPSFPLAFKWKYSLKSAVNAKLGHENLTLAAARKFWRSQKKG